jgi:hypothetical protein
MSMNAHEKRFGNVNILLSEVKQRRHVSDNSLGNPSASKVGLIQCLDGTYKAASADFVLHGLRVETKTRCIDPVRDGLGRTKARIAFNGSGFKWDEQFRSNRQSKEGKKRNNTKSISSESKTSAGARHHNTTIHTSKSTSTLHRYSQDSIWLGGGTNLGSPGGRGFEWKDHFARKSGGNLDLHCTVQSPAEEPSMRTAVPAAETNVACSATNASSFGADTISKESEDMQQLEPRPQTAGSSVRCTCDTTRVFPMSSSPSSHLSFNNTFSFSTDYDGRIVTTYSHSNSQQSVKARPSTVAAATLFLPLDGNKRPDRMEFIAVRRLQRLNQR